MAIVVNPMGRIFTIKITHEEESVEFGFKQLTYNQKSSITSQVSKMVSGQFTVDAALQVFLNLKHGLKTVKGLVDENNIPYKLTFESGPTSDSALTDACVDELLATVLSDNLQYAARELSGSMIPTEIKHPLTLKKLEGVEVIQPKKGDGVQKKS